VNGVTPRQTLLGRVRRLFSTSARSSGEARQAPDPEVEPGRTGPSRTIQVDPPAARGLRITYAPQTDGDPDAGEVVWTWVPYEENDGRGKDRPVLVIATGDAGRVFAVRLTSKSHDGDRDFLPIGSGPWDSRGRPSWVDIEQLYSVHPEGMRREASALDLDTFAQVASALQRRYGWSAGD
jgi:hypothetical protein